jgi:predicted aspartyl protease
MKPIRIAYGSVVNELKDVVTVVHGDWPANRAAVKCEAVWDTGSSFTIVTERLVKALGLRKIDGKKVLLHAGTGDTESECYEAWLVLKPGERPIKIVACVMPQPDTDVLIGMDVIASGRFAVDSTGDETVLTFEPDF